MTRHTTAHGNDLTFTMGREELVIRLHRYIYFKRLPDEQHDA